MVHRAFAVADDGGLTIVQIENDSTLPVAVAFSGRAVTSARPPTETPIQGIDLPADAQLFPIGHHAVLTVALPHGGVAAGAGALLPNRFDVAAVVRGWQAIADRAGRMSLPDGAHVEAVTAARCDLLLEGPAAMGDDPVAFLLGADALVRMSGGADGWVPDVATAVELVLRGPGGWDADAALDAAARVFVAAGEDRAVRDVAAHRGRWSAGAGRPSLPEAVSATDRARWSAWAERRLVHGGELLPLGLPREWLGQPIEVHGLPAGAASSVSFALRWHGARPAILWERQGQPLTLTAPHVAPGWSASAANGEALWPVPPGAHLDSGLDAPEVSFS